MVKKMSRLSVLLYHGEKEEFLTRLRNIGVVHIDGIDKDLSAKAASINAELVETQKTISEIKRTYKNLSGDCDLQAPEAIKKYIANSARIDAINNEISTIAKDKTRFEPWGDVSPETLAELRERKVYFSLYELPVKDRQILEEGKITYEIIKETATTLWIAVVGTDEPAVIEGKEPFLLPESSLKQLNAQESLIIAEKDRLILEQKEIASSVNKMEKYKAKLQDTLNFEIASTSMESAANEKLFSIEGWVPKEKLVQLQNTLDDFSCWYEFNEPTEKDDVPVRYNNNSVANKYEVITNLFALPKYHEIDPTPFFAPFYMIFFGFCVGDVGYGALILIGSILVYIMSKGGFKSIGALGMMLGFSTIIGGFLLNGFFGLPIFNSADGAGLFGDSGLGMYALLKSTEVSVLNNGEIIKRTITPMIPFSLFLGLFQILFGMFLKTLNKLKRNDYNIQYALFPIGTMFLTVAVALSVIRINFLDMGALFEVLFGITAMQIAQMIPSDMIFSIGGIGLVLLFLFNNPSKPIYLRLPLGFWELYQFTTGIMGDVLSYIRLFALGLAGGLLGASFNKIALMICGGEFNLSTPLIIFTILVLILGHVINIALASLGAFVHPLRLTFVEFYKYMDFQGGAREYKPFARVEV